MSTFTPDTLAGWAQVAGPIATTAGLGVAWWGNWRQGRARREDLERAQLEAARLVTVNLRNHGFTGELMEIEVLNRGASPIIDVRVWLEEAETSVPVLLAPKGGHHRAFLQVPLIPANTAHPLRIAAIKVIRADGTNAPLTGVVSWTSPDGIHWERRNATMLQRRPRAKLIQPDDTTSSAFVPQLTPHQASLLAIKLAESEHDAPTQT